MLAVCVRARARPSWTSCPPTRFIHTSGTLWAIRDRFVSEKDLNKKPSALEIERKGLPKNTPTLGDRLRRDRGSMFHQYDKKHGYFKGKTGTWRDKFEGYTTMQFCKEAFVYLKDNLIMFKDELMEDKLSSVARPGDTRVEFEFQDEDDLNRWVTTCDSDWGEGYSTCKLVMSPSGKSAVFSGELSTRVPQDGRITDAGYVNISSVRQNMSFGRLKDLRWNEYTELRMRVRGDGRRYFINILVEEEFDMLWNDTWHYPLFTRGGPYWQDVRIPWSKFYFGHQGRIQDSQKPVELHIASGIGFTLADRVDGPFQLEIENISLHYVENALVERFAYEEYMYPVHSYNKR